MGQVGGIAAPELQCHRVLLDIEAQVPLHAAMAQGPRRHHLGVQQGVAAQQAVEKAAMAIRPVHHGRNGQTPALGIGEQHGARLSLSSACLVPQDRKP